MSRSSLLQHPTLLKADHSGSYVPNQPPSDVAPRAGGYDASRSLYNPSAASLATLRAAMGKALAGSAYTELLGIGDSTWWGYAGAGAVPATIATPAQLNEMLSDAGFPDAGTGWVFTNAQGDNPETRWVLTGSWTSGAVGIDYMQTTTVGDSATFTSDHAGTVVGIAYFDNGGNFTYNIDGAGAVAVTPGGTSAVKVVTVSGLSNSTHAVVITTTSGGASTWYAVAARVRQSSGLAVAASGIPGSTTGHWAPGLGFNHPGPLLTSGLPGQSTPFAGSIVSLGLNDWFASEAPSAFFNGLSAITQAAPGSVLLVIPPTPSGADSNWTGYRQAYYNLADALGLPLLDLGDLLGSYATANTNGLRYDNAHPNAAGYALIAQAILSVISPRGSNQGDRAWKAVTLQNSWVNFGSGFATPGYRKDSLGRVHVRGTIKSGTATANTVLFALPAGYRPAATQVFATASADAFGEIRVTSAGNVTINAGVNTWLALDTISFLAEN